MNFRLVLAASLLALAACQPATPPTSEAAAPAAPETATAPPAGACDVRVETPWINEATRRYTIEANVSGPTCKQGVVLLVVRQGDGAPVFSWSGLTDYLFGLRDAADPAAMKAALSDWFAGNAEVETTETLPPWEQTDGQPARADPTGCGDANERQGQSRCRRAAQVPEDRYRACGDQVLRLRAVNEGPPC